MPNANIANGFRAVALLGGGHASFPLYTFPAKSNLSLAPGDAVVMLTTGSLDIAGVASTAIYGVCQSKITAIAATRQDVQIIPAIEGILWEAQYGTSATTLVNLGANRDIGGGSGAMVLSSTSAGGAPARIIGLAPGPKNALGQYMRVQFVWNKSQWTGQA